MTETWIQYVTRYIGGGEHPVYLTHHKACGAFVADAEQHDRVCTAPPWEPIPDDIGRITDYDSDGSIT